MLKTTAYRDISLDPYIASEPERPQPESLNKLIRALAGRTSRHLKALICQAQNCMGSFIVRLS